MSQQTDMLLLNIRKRRSGSVASSTDAEPISETIQWLRELIEKDKNGQRVMSPLTEERARQIIESLEGIEGDLDTDAPAVHAVRSTLLGLKTEMSCRIETDAKYAECRVKLEKLSKDGFFLRYGDYFANAIGDLRRAAVKVSKEAKKTYNKARKQKGEVIHPHSETDAMKFFLTRTWIQIDKALTIEDERLESSVSKPQTPMTDLIENLAKIAKIPDYGGIRIAITMYAQRNGLVHQHLAEMAKAGDFFGLAIRLQDDLRALVAQKHITLEEREATHVAILKMADRYFEEFKLDQYTYKLFDYRPRPMGNDGNPIRKKSERSAPSNPRRSERFRCGKLTASTSRTDDNEEGREGQEDEDDDFIILE